MAWLAKDESGFEFIYEYKPHRYCKHWESDTLDDQQIALPSGSIQKLIGRELTWEDDCVEI